MSTPHTRMIALLVQYQKRHQIDDAEMGRRLGIAPTSWQLFRLNLRNMPRPGILGGFARLYPKRRQLLRDFLAGDAGDAA